MREASTKDREFVAGCFVSISLYVKSQASDIYIDGLPNNVDIYSLELAGSYIERNDAITLIVERAGGSVACIAAKIENTSFGPSDVGRVGNIAICWVAPEYRKQNIAKELVANVESWFLDRGIDVVELSYLAQNTLAENAWRNFGYTPFRVFSHKVIKNP